MRIALTTCSPEDAETLARSLVASGAACVNILNPIRSIYTWKGEVHDDTECLLIVKAATERMEALRQALVSQHPYDLPEWVVLAPDADQTSRAYRLWVRQVGGY